MVAIRAVSLAAWAVEEALEERETAPGGAVGAFEDYPAMASWEKVEPKEVAGTKGVAVAAAASADRVKAQQVEGTAVAGRGVAGGRWAAPRAAEGDAAAPVGWEAAGGRAAEMVGREAAAGRVAVQRYGRRTRSSARPNPTGLYSTAVRWGVARVEVERQRQGSLYPH